MLAQHFDRTGLNVLKVIFALMIASARLARTNTSDTHSAPVVAVKRHAAAALSAFENAGQHSRTLRRTLRRHIKRALFYTGLHLRRRFLVYDPQRWHVFALPLAFGIVPAYALARLRIADHCYPVPNQYAVIDGIAQHAILARFRAVKRRSVPNRASRRDNTVAVQINRYLPRCPTQRIFPEYAANDSGFILVNDKFARLAENRLIAVSFAAC
ncbi:hypothetical protein NO134_12630 [Ochrobactrum sp. BD22]|nr:MULTISPECIES: hypothetical protein [unclassified Ochrobactrum]